MYPCSTICLCMSLLSYIMHARCMFVCHIGKLVMIRVIWTFSGIHKKFRDPDVHFKSSAT